MKIFRFEGSLYFASCEKFREMVYLRTGVNPRQLLRLSEKAARAAPKPSKSVINANTDIKEIEMSTTYDKDVHTNGELNTGPDATLSKSIGTC